MNPDRQQALGYLRAPADGLWRWSDGGTVLVWRDGATIAFRDEALGILEWLAPQGLPPFDALVLLLAAVRGKVPLATEVTKPLKALLPPESGVRGKLLLLASQRQRQLTEAALDQLRRLHQLPPELQGSLKAKCILAEAVFEFARPIPYTDAKAVLRGARAPIYEAELNMPAGAAEDLVRELHLLSIGLKPHTVESLTLRLRTGLDAVPQATDAVLPAAERARRLIDELGRDPEHGAVARAARELMAAVRLPRHLGERDELALGGVADLTNRGPLDRLLLSELAHDDLTLAARVALNEALYLRREPPVREPPGTLAFLLDSGVRLWGVPRVLASAVALALAACDRQHAQILTWRAQGKELRPVDLLSRSGLTDHLAALEVEAHFGAALPALRAALPTGLEHQAVFITHRDALADAEFRRALAEWPSASGFVAVVDRTGSFALHALPLAQRPPLCEAMLDVATVFAECKGAAPLIRRELAPGLPAIFGIEPFPLLLPFAGKLERWTKTPDDHLCAVFNDRRLIEFRDQQRGGRVLVAQLPPGQTAWMDATADTVRLVKAGASQRPFRLVTVSRSGGPMRVVDLVSGPNFRHAHVTRDVLMLSFERLVVAFSLADGRRLGEREIEKPGTKWIHERFLFRNEALNAIIWNGQQIVLIELLLPHSVQAEDVALVFDMSTSKEDGPALVTKAGDVFTGLYGQTRFRLKAPHPLSAKHLMVSTDGRLLAATSPGLITSLVMDLKTGATDEVKPGYPFRQRFNPEPPLPIWNLYRVVEHLALTDAGRLHFLGRKGQWRSIQRETFSETNRLRICASRPTDADHQRSPKLSPQPVPPEHGCTLHVATWLGGGQVFHDSRGLLHFKSQDATLAEVTLVLADGEVAGWTSDGHVCGPQFFLPEGRTSEPEAVHQCLEHILSLL
ncbi:MAG: Uncharacterized protein FD161_2233 [Limisphaerales bacterium]|nr:MAG: Uncharacterized protein FD161_2233 [Limisphaerales bacterium]KAG0508745.1 MAG: Uncharacterized protein E1N63_2035 [Limisphaerales bacterium]TXT50564.1 MAG: Uncharacterized protein FD140_2348 [Limisphaerales bacterium]